MGRPTEVEEESVEQLFAHVAAFLVEAEVLLLPSLEAKVQTVRDTCNRAFSVLRKLEQTVARQELQK